MPRRNRGGDRRWGSARKQWDDWTPDDPRERRERRPHARRTRAEPAPPPKPSPAPTPQAQLALVCGNCLEWYAHEVGGRGDCGHPGSGFVSPWSDTPACPFFVARR